MAEHIDREAFISHEESIYCKDCSHRKNSKGKMVYAIGGAPCRACGIMDVLDDVAEYPAADVKPINPAEWIEDGYQGLPCVCSYCGEPGKRDWRFCPYCGATMKVAQDPAPDPKSTFYDLLYEEGGANTT